MPLGMSTQSSESSTSGQLTDGNPVGISPTVATPWAARSRTALMAMAAASTNETAGKPGHEALQEEERGEGGHADDQGHHARVAQIAGDVRELADRVPLALLEAEELRELRDGHEDRQPEDEARHHRPRQEVRDEPEPAQPGRDEQDPGDDDERRRQLREVLLARVQGRDRREDEHGRGRGAGYDEVTARPEDGVQGERGQQRVQAGLRGQTGQAGVGDHLGDQQPPDGEAGHRVGRQPPSPIPRQPPDDRHEPGQPE